MEEKEVKEKPIYDNQERMRAMKCTPENQRKDEMLGIKLDEKK